MTFKLKRFAEEKQDQIEQLISYANLLGLSGADLVSIGGKMTRDSKRDIVKTNMEIVRGFECLKIGGDWNISSRFKLKMPEGNYNIHNGGWSFNEWTIHSLKTKAKKTVVSYPDNYDLPRVNYQIKSRYALLLDIAAGKIKLDF